MRTIKFRAWITEAKQMIEHNVIDFNDFLHKTNLYGSINHSYCGDDDILMQFTGLYDKNGKEIYEGDILFCHEYDSSDTSRCIVQTFKNAVVGFNNGSFYYYPTGNMKQPNQLLMYAYKPEVIGNIYENTELLNN